MLYVKLAVALAFAGLLAWLGQTLYQAGYNSAMSESLDARMAHESVLATQFGDVIAKSESDREAALRELEAIRNKPPEIITDVQIKTIERNVCNSWDAEFVELLDGATD